MKALSRHTNHNPTWQITVSVLLVEQGSDLFPPIHPFSNKQFFKSQGFTHL